MSETRTQDRRRHPRLQLPHPVSVGDEGGSVAHLIDVSRIGASATTSEPMAEMTLLRTRFTLGGNGLPSVEIDCTAAVVRCEELAEAEWEIGLYFTDLSDHAREELDAYIESAMATMM